jgi:hypothetical protein
MVNCKEAPWQYFFILIAIIFFAIIYALNLVVDFSITTVIGVIIQILLLIFLIYLLTKLFVMKDPAQVCCTTALIVFFLIGNIFSIISCFMGTLVIWYVVLLAIASVVSIAACIIYFVNKGNFEKVGPDNGTPPPSQPGYPPGNYQPGYPSGGDPPGGYPPGGYYTPPPSGNYPPGSQSPPPGGSPPGDVVQTP